MDSHAPSRPTQTGWADRPSHPNHSTQYYSSRSTQRQALDDCAENENAPVRRSPRYRAPTVLEALPFTPLTSVIPFSSDLLPYPWPTSTSKPNLLNDEQRRRSRSQMNLLDRETASRSAVMTQNLQKVRSLLSDATTYDFIAPRNLAIAPVKREMNGTRSTPRKLGSFAQAALDTSNVPYRYPTPSDSPSPSKVHRTIEKQAPSSRKRKASHEQNGVDTESVSGSLVNKFSNQQKTGNQLPQTGRATSAGDQESALAQNIAQTQASVTANQFVAVVIPSPSKTATPPKQRQMEVPPQPSPAQLSLPAGPAIVISGLPPSSQRSDYQDFSRMEAKTAVGQKRKRDMDDDGRTVEIRIDQRAKSEESVRALETTIAQLSSMHKHHLAGDANVDTSFFFVKTAYQEDDTIVLTRPAQERLESAIVRAIDSHSFAKVGTAGILKVQKLLESTLSLIEALTLTVDDAASSEDIEEWLNRVQLTENALLSARILLRILTAGREDKELYSENTLQTIAECVDLVMNRAVIPIVELRNSGSDESLFKIYSANKRPLISLLNMYGQVLRLMGDLIAKVDVESVVSRVQDISTKLIFVENGYTDRDSALGTVRFEKLRTRAMHVVATIFHRYANQRRTIFNEIVTSLEKVPVARQSAKQFKAHEGKSIQLVSALLMRLVQTSGTRSTGVRKQGAVTSASSPDSSDEGDDGPSRQASPSKAGVPGDMEVEDEMEPEHAEQDLHELANPLYESALKDAGYLISYIVGRAQNTTKTGDQPYRKLLDIFVEDFLSVLGLPMWPGAEMLLRALLSTLLRLLKDDKTAAPAKNMALEVLGTIGSGIIDLHLYLDHQCRATESSNTPLTSKLISIAQDYLENGDEQQVNKFRGPYRVLMEFLRSQSLHEVQAPSARGLHLTSWAKTTLVYLEREDGPAIAPDLARQLRNMILDFDWLQSTYDAIEAVITPQQARLAASIITVAAPVGRQLPVILDQLVAFMTTAQSNLKSRSLKSVTDLITKDPSILERNRSVLYSIVKGVQDSSPQVRDSALLLLDKCLVLKPKLADKFVYARIIQLVSDDSKSVRKHAMKILKEIYLRSSDQDLQAACSEALMARVNDIEPNVKDMAREIFEELWMQPFYQSTSKDAVQRKIMLRNQVVLITKTVQRGEQAVELLDMLLHHVLRPESKTRASNLDVCRDLVRLMFDEIIDNEEKPDRPSQEHLAQALTSFARAEPMIFTSDQLRLLLPYLQNMTLEDQLPLYRYVSIITRHVIPSLPLSDRELIHDIQGKLMAPIARLKSTELAEAARSLWVIHGILKDERIVKLLRSALKQVYDRKDFDFKDSANQKHLNQVKRYMEITGYFGRECNLDEYAEQFRQALPFWKGKSVSALIIDLFCPFTKQKYPEILRQAALDSIATVCQSWPIHYQRPDVSLAFDLVFRNDDKPFMQVVLNGFLLFFKQEERRSESGAAIKVGEGADKGSERLQKSFIAGDSDAGATTIAQKFLPHILRVARSSLDKLAVTATYVIASINRQGLVHPKECGPILVVLETSTNKTIADIAFTEHKIQHLKNESVFDKHYMASVQQAFEYQRDVIMDARGVTLQPTTPKLHMLFDVLKTGSGKVRKRFLGNLVSRMDFEPSKLNVKLEGTLPTALQYARFLVENLGFFDYVRVDEILHLVSCLERLVVHGVGTTVAHAIETEILKVELPKASQSTLPVPIEPEPTDPTIFQRPFSALPVQTAAPQIDPARLRQLTVASMILNMVWATRTHLRQLWGLSKQGKNAPKLQAKDMNRPATKAPFFRSELLEKIDAIMHALDDYQTQVLQCRAFAEIVAVDNEHRIEEDDEEAELARQAAGYETPDEERETGSNASQSGKGRKRKSSIGAIGTPSAKRMREAGTPRKKVRPKGAKGKMGRGRSASAMSEDEE